MWADHAWAVEPWAARRAPDALPEEVPPPVIIADAVIPPYVPLPPLMRVLKPQTVTDAMLTSSSVADDPTAAWAAGTTYASGVTIQHAHRLYQSLQAGNLGKTPGATASAAWWLDLGPTARWAMFDQAVGTSTSAPEVLQVVLTTTEFVNAVALVGVVGYEASLLMRSSTGVLVYSRTLTIGGSAGASFYDYFFGEHETTGDLIFDQLPPYVGASITVTITAPATASCGVMLIGRLHDVGILEKGASAGIVDYSRKDTDEFGTATLLQRDYASEASYPLVVTAADMRRLKSLIASVRAVPCLWVGDPDTDTYAPWVVYGWYDDFRLVAEYEQHARMSLDVKGLT